MKIQQMAFVLIALMVLFGLAALMYLMFTVTEYQSKAKLLREDLAREAAAKLSGVPELSFSSEGECATCIDFDKALLLKEQSSYVGFWNVDYLQIQKIFPPSPEVECTLSNYPKCNKITYVQNKGYGSVSSAVVTLVHWEQITNSRGQFKYEIGKIYYSEKDPAK